MNLQTVAKRCRHGALAGAIAVALALPFGSTATAATIDLAEWGLNVDGTFYGTFYPPLLPPSVNTAGFDFSTGLGTLILNFTVPDTYSVVGFFDHEIDEATNTFFNEFGRTTGTPGAGQSWEIDEPGFVFGDIYANFLAGALDNSNGVPDTAPDDVSMAMGWNFTLGSGEVAKITFSIGETAPSGFYLRQADPDSSASLYLSSTLSIGNPDQNVPEPTSLALLGLGLAALAAARRNKAIA